MPEYQTCNQCYLHYNVDPTVRDVAGNEMPLHAQGYCRRCSLCRNCGRLAATPPSLRCAHCSCAHVESDGRICGYAAGLAFDNPPDNRTAYRRTEDSVMLCRIHYAEKYAAYMCTFCNGRGGYSRYYTGANRDRSTACQTCANSVLDGMTNAPEIRCACCTRRATSYVNFALVCSRHTSLSMCERDDCLPMVPCPRCLRHQRDREIERQEMQRLQRHQRMIASRHQRETDGTCRTDCRACASLFTAANGHGMPVFHPAIKISERRKNRSKRFISVEIEVAGIRRPQHMQLIDATLAKWGARRVHDGSLPSGGFEINTAPAAGDHFVQQVNEICAALAKAGAFANESCGLHVHADARDFKYMDIRNVVLLWEKLEPAFMATQSAARTSSHYCRPVGSQYADAFRTLSMPDFVKEAGKPKGVKKRFFEGVYGTHESEFRSFRPQRDNHYNDSRYHNLNLHSWIYRGTVENRLHSGTIVARKIIDWATTWAKFMDTAYAANEKEISVIDNPVDFMLTRIAPTKSAAAYLTARMRTYAADYSGRRT